MKVNIQNKEILVDEDVWLKYRHFNWKIDKDGYVCLKIDKKWYSLARLIMSAPEHLQVDHKDRNPLNNLRDNLRLATVQQNACNRRIPEGKTSRFRGVYFTQKTVKVKGKPYTYDYWTAQVKLNGKIVFSKTFKDEEEAAKAYDKKALELYGEFAQLNFPETVDKV